MALSLTQTALVRVTAGQAVTNNLLRLLALSPSVSISGSVGTADLAAGAVTAAKATPGAYFFTDTAGVAMFASGSQPICHFQNGFTSRSGTSGTGAVFFQPIRSKTSP